MDHGKSTIIGRLLADTGSLPDGKLEQVRATCARSGKPFEWAFLLDALQDEQAQGITIDAARVFFRTAKRPYLIVDAPGHIEFLRNMITGASQANTSKHLALLLEQGLVGRRRHGLFTRYRIADPTLERLCRLVCGSLAERHESVRSHLAS